MNQDAQQHSRRSAPGSRPAPVPAPVPPTVERAIEYLEAHADEPVTLATLSATVGVGATHLQRRFKQHTGLSPREFQAALRMRRFRHGVRAGRDVTGATYEAGFGSSRGLYEFARQELGMTPGSYARRGAELAIAWCIEDCSLGRVLVASTVDGVCAVLLGDDDAALIGELRGEFDRAELSESATTRRPWVEAVLAHLESVDAPLAVPLDPRGTPFQVRVWRALRDIPAGERRTYAQVAAAAGSPRAVRAVGNACAHNTIAVLVPCHRVVRADGSAGRYRWGNGRKRALLDRERAAAAERAR